MFHDLFWALYWIDVLGGLAQGLVACIGVGVVSAFVYCLVKDHDKPGPTMESVRRGFLFGFFIIFPLLFIPAKSTMYMMLGVKTTDNVVSSPLGQKLQRIVDLQIDDYLKKLTPTK